MNKIEEIASKHLGKAGDGSVVKPYVTPDNVDPDLLVGIPRELNRTAYGIDEKNLPFVGFDRWNCYEFSTLTDNGFPVSGTLVYNVPCDSPNITESKSSKLYMNSYNMDRFGESIAEVKEGVEQDVFADINKCVGVSNFDNVVSVALHTPQDYPMIADPITGTFLPLEEAVDPTKVSFDHYNEDPNILKVVDNDDTVRQYKSHSLRSNCRVTNQPDWGDIYIAIKGSRTVTPESLLQYVVSMRKENHFHEEICECVYKRLYDLLDPKELFVACLYTRRGGIDINPVRASSYDFLYEYACNLDNVYVLNNKTQRQ